MAMTHLDAEAFVVPVMRLGIVMHSLTHRITLATSGLDDQWH
jgi:hypothetical protein